MTPRVALVNDRTRLAMQVTIEQAVEKPVDLHEAEGLFPCHHIGSQIRVACAEIRDLSAWGQPIHDVCGMPIHKSLS